jgi:hypothetical protein
MVPTSARHCAWSSGLNTQPLACEAEASGMSRRADDEVGTTTGMLRAAGSF